MTEKSDGVLYVVATPLGHLEDLSPRAVRILRGVDLVACEDTRRTVPLLRRHGITTPTLSYHEHNERERAPELVARVKGGASIALVSDAGTPAISDPGEHLVRVAREAGLSVIPVPGPSAAVAALSVSGLASGRFLFVGFLPSRATQRQRALEELKDREETLIFYESPLRIVAMLGDAEAAFGDRIAFLCREATKVHEEYVRERLSVLREVLRDRGDVKGEIVLVVSGRAEPPNAIAGEIDTGKLLDELRQRGLAPRAAAREAARLTGRKARDLYQELVRGHRTD